ncbi:uncharacterized protein LOC100903326 [Galendromus occidentalis]|uniref:Uncharacterized protein LOC100903326 n=1 Tax=Galendromus occidentalis TaxID=34638 RepID=A0AAJ6VZE9_9ACAR|nr:uncharacterized protein LOC100903326 [Galendromus occidentalis]
MWVVSLETLINVFCFHVGFAVETEQSSGPEFFETVISEKLRLLPKVFESKCGPVHRCSGDSGSVYGISTAFQMSGSVECKLRPTAISTECEIPLKVQWLRARIGNEGSDEIFFKMARGRVVYHENLGIREDGFEDLIEQIVVDDASHALELQSIRRCVISALNDLNTMLSCLILGRQPCDHAPSVRCAL